MCHRTLDLKDGYLNTVSKPVNAWSDPTLTEIKQQQQQQQKSLKEEE